MEAPKISIIVPCYNLEKYVRKCLHSLTSQSFEDIEIIAVNDGSKDRTLSILQEHAEWDARIRVINKENAGLSEARNTGMASALGEYILFVDGDDWLDEQTCQEAYQKMEEHQADVVMWSYVREYETGSLPKTMFQSDMVFDEAACHNLHRRFAGLVDRELASPEDFDSIVTAWGKMYRRVLIEDHGLRFIDLKKIGTYEDGMFNLEYFAFVKKAVFINQCFSHYLKSNQTALTKSYKPSLFKTYKDLFILMEDYIDSNGLPDDFRQALSNRICHSLIGIGVTECLPANPRNDYEKIRFLKKVLKDSTYHSALCKLPLRYFPPHWSAFYALAKNGNAAGVYLMLRILSRIIER